MFATMFESGRGAADIVAAEGLAQTVDTSAIERVAREVIEKSPENVAKFKSGHEGVFGFRGPGDESYKRASKSAGGKREAVRKILLA